MSALENLPPTLTYAELSTTHEKYRPDLLTKYQDLYAGGEQFHKNIDNYLIKRQIEMGSGGDRHVNLGREMPGVAEAVVAPSIQIGQTQWDARKKVSRINH